MFQIIVAPPTMQFLAPKTVLLLFKSQSLRIIFVTHLYYLSFSTGIDFTYQNAHLLHAAKSRLIVLCINNKTSDIRLLKQTDCLLTIRISFSVYQTIEHPT